MRVRASSKLRCWLGRLAPFVLAGLARPAQAQPALPLSVEREAGAEACPDTEQLIERVVLVRGDARLAEGSAYRVSFSRNARGFSATIHPGASEAAPRQLEASEPSCAALAHATAVTLAMLLDAELASAAAEPAQVAPAPPKPSLSPALSPLERPSPIRPQLSVGAAALVGVLRPLTLAGVADVGFETRSWRGGVGLLWAPPQHRELLPGSVTTKLLAATLRLCYGYPLRRAWRFDGCSGVLLGAATAEARGFTVNQRQSELFLALPAELAVSVRSRFVGLELAAAALWLTPANEFVVGGVGPAYRPSAVAGMVTLRALLMP